MQHSFRQATLSFFLSCLFLLSIVSSAAGASTGPQQIYERAWQLVRDSYVDPTYNGQNWESWHHRYDGRLQTTDQAYDAIKEMLASLKDQYTRFLDPQAIKNEDDAINSTVCGIGISLRPYDETHRLIVNDVLDGSPAAGAGIQYGDEITSINGQSCVNCNNDQAAEKIRGQAGTTVALTLKHGDAVKQCSITRRQITIPAVITKTLDNNIGYIKLTTFMSDDASAEFRWALQNLSGTRGLILDLRNNPGGLLANAVEIADMLIDRGKIVTTISRHGTITDRSSGMVLTTQPMVVLVDRDSASASEILAGALRDNGRAMIVGTQTYGKGLVQEITRLPGGAGLHITVARYLTPSGRDINKIGIAPDVQIDGRDKQLARGVDILNQAIAQRGEPSVPRRYGFGYHSVSPRS
jgi:carboxyl-terminal processing protease